LFKFIQKTNDHLEDRKILVFAFDETCISDKITRIENWGEEIMNVPEGLNVALNFGLLDSIFTRRSKRFGLGMEIKKSCTLLIFYQLDK
jgi:hypothetical protein